MNCPNCGALIPPEDILRHRQQELAKRPRKPNNNNPYGRKGKPKPEKETGK